MDRRMRRRAKDKDDRPVRPSTLGSRLAGFKATPLLHLSDVSAFGIHRRPLFVGACDSCTPHCRATLPSDSLALEMCVKKCDQSARMSPPETKIPSGQFKDRFIRHILANGQELSRQYEVDFRGFDDREAVAKGLELFKVSETKTDWQRWLEEKMLPWMFPKGILCHPGQLLILEKCLMSEDPFVFLPILTAKWDPLVLATVLKSWPLVFTGKDQNLHYPSNILMFDPLNWSQTTAPDNWCLQHIFVTELLRGCRNFVIFLDHYDSILPKVYNSSLAALTCIAESLEYVNDVKIVPVSFSYDSVPESCYDVWSKDRGVRVDLDQPFSLRAFTDSHKSDEDDYRSHTFY